MFGQFKLIREEFDLIHQERQWTYACLSVFTFNYRIINQITITDHPWKKSGRELITKELILEILDNLLNSQKMEVWRKHGQREVFVWDWSSYQGRKYHFTFWFKDNTNNHLWIRNCYPLN